MTCPGGFEMMQSADLHLRTTRSPFTFATHAGTDGEGGVQLYTKLQKEDRVRDVLENMYAWGKQHAWDPAALKESPRDPVDA